jgi:hypothetical protein
MACVKERHTGPTEVIIGAYMIYLTDIDLQIHIKRSCVFKKRGHCSIPDTTFGPVYSLGYTKVTKV